MRRNTAGLALAMAVVSLLTTRTARAQAGYLVALGGTYTSAAYVYAYPGASLTYAIPTAVQGYTQVSYGYAQPSCSMIPVSYLTVGYPQVAVTPAGYAPALVYYRTW